MRVLEMLDNKWLSQMVADLRKVMKLNRHNSLFKSGRVEESLQEHRELMQALAARNAEQAQHCVKLHFRNGLAAAV